MAGFVTRTDTAFGGFAAAPLWTTALAAQTSGLVYVKIENRTDKNIDVSFDGTNEHEYIASGFFLVVDFPSESAQGGAVSVRGESTDPTSGSVIVSARTR